MAVVEDGYSKLFDEVDNELLLFVSNDFKHLKKKQKKINFFFP